MLKYLEKDHHIVDPTMHIPNLPNLATFYVRESQNEEYNGLVTRDPRAITLGIVQEIGIAHIIDMTPAQRASWISIVSGQIRPYLIKCDRTKGKRSGLSYNISLGIMNYRYHCKYFSSFPVIFGKRRGVIGINWINKAYALFPDGTVKVKNSSVKYSE
jgi:hypothetical protein